jgi:hypothetical protein
MIVTGQGFQVNSLIPSNLLMLPALIMLIGGGMEKTGYNAGACSTLVHGR